MKYNIVFFYGVSCRDAHSNIVDHACLQFSCAALCPRSASFIVAMIHRTGKYPTSLVTLIWILGLDPLLEAINKIHPFYVSNQFGPNPWIYKFQYASKIPFNPKNIQLCLKSLEKKWFYQFIYLIVTYHRSIFDHQIK